MNAFSLVCDTVTYQTENGVLESRFEGNVMLSPSVWFYCVSRVMTHDLYTELDFVIGSTNTSVMEM